MYLNSVLCQCGGDHPLSLIADCICNKYSCSCPYEVVSTFLDCIETSENVGSSGGSVTNNTGGAGSTGSTFTSNTALNNLMDYVDNTSKSIIQELKDTPCEGQLEIFYLTIVSQTSNPNHSLITKINCSIQNLEVTSGGGCDVSTSENYTNFSFDDLDDELQSWILSATSEPDAVLNNPVCDMIEAGYTPEEVNAYLAFIKPALENEPDPGYNGGEPDPYSAYNINTDDAKVNKVTQFLIDYPCVESMDYMGLLLSEPEVVDWAIEFLDGDCGDLDKIKYINLGLTAYSSFDEIALTSIDTFGYHLLADIYPELLIPSHKASFPMTKIGNAYYCQTNFINLGFWHELNPWNWVSFCIPNLCIQVPTQNTQGSFNIHDVPKKVVEAFDETRKALLEMAWMGTITTSAQGRSAFVSTLESELSEHFKVSESNISVNQNTCNNDCGIANYGVNILTAKASPGECFYD